MSDPWHEWWQTAVVYQIYPRSFQDSDGDGIGDLGGVLDRLDYLTWLGVSAVWLSPIYPSPMADFGYDISNYTDIDPVFGSLDQFDTLVREIHQRGLKLIMDLVPNHSSDQHPWFVDSRSSRTSARRNWYIWRDPAPDGGPPNNWLSEFGGPAWTLDAGTGQYYYHAFLSRQPDLNWREPQVRAAMHDVMRFWLDREVDGFRVDAIHMLMEDESLTDNPPNPDWRPGHSPARRLLRTYTADLPETQLHIAGMRKVVDEYQDRVLIGEAYLPVRRMMAYYGDSLGGIHLPFNFHLIKTAFEAPAIASLVTQYEAALPAGGWPNWVLGNHDKSRLVTRLGGVPQARLAAMLLLTLRGTPTLYNGDEIGMADGLIHPDQVRDPWEKNAPGLGLGRDPCRTPMQWSAQPGAGFSTGTSWLPLGTNTAQCNVAVQSADPSSLLSFYRQLLGLRQRESCLMVGEYRLVEATEHLLVYERVLGERILSVALNFTAEHRSLALEGGHQMLLSTHAGLRPDMGAQMALAPYEGIVFATRINPVPDSIPFG